MNDSPTFRITDEQVAAGVAAGERRKRLDQLSNQQWTEIYYAVEAVINRLEPQADEPTADGVSVPVWLDDLQGIQRIIGPDGSNMWKGH